MLYGGVKNQQTVEGGERWGGRHQTPELRLQSPGIKININAWCGKRRVVVILTVYCCSTFHYPRCCPNTNQVKFVCI